MIQVTSQFPVEKGVVAIVPSTDPAGLGLAVRAKDILGDKTFQQTPKSAERSFFIDLFAE